jgi:stage III sporulation protein AF
MKSVILSVGCLVLLLSIISMILPNGKASIYVKSIFSVFILLAILKPIIETKEAGLNFDYSTEKNEVFLQEDYLSYVFEKRKDNIQENCSKILKNNGITGANITIIYEIKNMTFNVTKIEINLENAVINSDKEHIFVIEESKKNIAEYLYIRDAQIYIYEK